MGSEIAFPLMAAWLATSIIVFLVAMWMNKGTEGGVLKSAAWGCGCVILLVIAFVAAPGVFIGLFFL